MSELDFQSVHVPICLKSMSESGPRLNIKPVFPGMGIPMLKIRRSQDRLIFNMGIFILIRRHIYIEMAPDLLSVHVPVC